jgi:hypothetical protein
MDNAYVIRKGECQVVFNNATFQFRTPALARAGLAELLRIRAASHPTTARKRPGFGQVPDRESMLARTKWWRRVLGITAHKYLGERWD